MRSKRIILAVETSSRIGSVALATDEGLLGETTFSASLRHSAEIFPAIAELLARFGHTPSDITHVCISIGPGSFTGLRIAVAAAKAMHLAGSAQIVTVNSLDTIVANVSDAAAGSLIQNGAAPFVGGCRLATVLDAKRGQFYTAGYAWVPPEEPTAHPESETAWPGYRIPAPGHGRWHKTLSDRLMTAAEIIETCAPHDGPLYITGDGLLHHQDKFRAEGVRVLDREFWSPHAARLYALGRQKARAGRFTDPLKLAPFYLRGPQVTLRKTARAPATDAPPRSSG